jgi:hypothetical protein
MVLSWVKELEYWYDLVTLIWPFSFVACGALYFFTLYQQSVTIVCAGFQYAQGSVIAVFDLTF